MSVLKHLSLYMERKHAELHKRRDTSLSRNQTTTCNQVQDNNTQEHSSIVKWDTKKLKCVSHNIYYNYSHNLKIWMRNTYDIL